MQSKRIARSPKAAAPGLRTFWTFARRDLLGSEPVRLMLWQRAEARRRQLAGHRPRPAFAMAAG